MSLSNLGNHQRTFGPNKANVKVIYYTIPVIGFVGIILLLGGLGKDHPRDVAGFVFGGIVFPDEHIRQVGVDFIITPVYS
jgi:hypothetical protein